MPAPPSPTLRYFEVGAALSPETLPALDLVVEESAGLPRRLLQVAPGGQTLGAGWAMKDGETCVPIRFGDKLRCAPFGFTGGLRTGVVFARQTRGGTAVTGTFADPGCTERLWQFDGPCAPAHVWDFDDSTCPARFSFYAVGAEYTGSRFVSTADRSTTPRRVQCHPKSLTIPGSVFR